MDTKNKMINKFKELVRWFVLITTGILIVCAVDFTIFGEEQIPRATLWQILLVGFVTASVTNLFWNAKDSRTKGGQIACILCHYISLCAIMAGCGTAFGWMELNLKGMGMMAVSVAGVYLFSFSAKYALYKKQAEEINRKLKEKYDEDSN